MANMCDNHLEFFCKAKPDWFKIDPETSHGISVEVDPHFLFLYNDFESLTCDLQDDGTFFIEFGFETKWSPPEDLYESMVQDDNITNFIARWFEPGCQVLGYANKEEGIVDEDCPNVHYSEFLDLDVLQAEPTDNYIELNGTDSWITFNEYKEEMQKHLDKDDNTIIAKQELEEVTEYFNS